MTQQEEIDKMYEEFLAELAENDRLVKENPKTRTQLTKEFVDFIVDNNCKLKGLDDGTEEE